LLVKSLVDPFGQEIPVAAADDSLGDEYHNLTQLLKLVFVADALGLVTAKTAGVVDQQDIEQIQSSVFQKLLELFAFIDTSTRDELGVPTASQS
jgi:hypothetical protein